MAAKLLHSLADDNPDFQRQIGCMTGMFQIFDRPSVLTSRRISHRRLPPGRSQFTNGSIERESNNAYNRQSANEINLNKNLNEKQRISTESSRASFSSSCSSTLSSLDFSRTAQPETSSDQVILSETPSREPLMYQHSASPHLGLQSLDLRDVVKDSMYREARGLSVKTTTKEEGGRALRRRDSPRPSQLPKSGDGSSAAGTSMKQNTPADLKESLKALAKLREAPWYYTETKELPISSYESKDGSWSSIPRDAPRFSYDGREINRLSFESRENLKSTTKLKELPRLSLDGREGSLRNSHSDSRQNQLSKNFLNGGLKDKTLILPQSLVAQKRPPSVVAKLMGLETLPDSALHNDGQLRLSKAVEDGDPLLRSRKTDELGRAIRLSMSPRNSLKDPASPRRRNPDFIMKPTSSSRFPIEPAPWKQLDGNRVSQKPSFRPVKVPPRVPNSSSVYSEIEKRLKDLEFKQAGKDLRALKQILEAMQAKGLLEMKEEERAEQFETQGDTEAKRTGSNQNSKQLGQQNPQRNHVVTSPSRGSNSSRTFESAIVIMKPAKLVERSGIPASSVIPIDDISSLHKGQSSGFANSKRGSINSQTTKDQSPKNSGRNSSVSNTDKRASGQSMRSTQSSSSRSQPSPKGKGTKSEKSTGSVSPRLQQKKLELEKRSRPPTPPSDSNKPRKQYNRPLKDSGSPSGKVRPKSSNLQLSDDQLSEVSYESRSLSCQGDDISVESDGNFVLDSKLDIEVTSAEQSTNVNGSQSPSMKAVEYLASGSVQKKSTSRLDEGGSLAELATAAPEHPSPVSVLDASVYRDDEISPVKQLPSALKGESTQESNDSHCEDQWNNTDNLLSNSVASGLTSDINRKKLQNIEHLVQKLRRLNSNHDEARTDYIASLCENANPDQRYISEILLASGLLLRDLGSDLTTFQLHPSGHPINPELFFVLEQTKASSLLSKEDDSPVKVANSKPDLEKFHRKLIFDAVNEILMAKLSLFGMCPEPWLKPYSLARKTVSAQKLLKELCNEIEQFQAKKLLCSLEEEEDDLKSILWEDVMHRSGSWTDFQNEISGMVLDVERLVFKDLVDEIVIGEAASLRAKRGRRRQLFSK